jgi:Mg-chelatase subunit ChlD
LNLARTIRGNLANAVRREDGRTTIVAKDLIFNSASKREMDWYLTFVVDVSGSMTSSVVYSALCAAIFAELPALSIRFLAFSTQVVDLSGHVSDPLTLLLEVQVGGGTNIGLGLRHARAGLRVPSRSMVVLVTDFEEGVSTGEMIAETRALIEAGVKCIGLAALNDHGVARFHQGCAQMMASAGMPIAAVSPEKLAQWVGDQIRGN